MAPSKILANVPLKDAATSGQTSTVGEPSVARSGDVAIYTGNWYAAHSFDGGATWSHVDPYSYFPSADGGFCCDQTVMYDPSREIFIWLLQYRVDAAKGQNTLRVAVCPANEVVTNGWHFWDFVPEDVDSSWTNEWFDYNHSALSDNFLYVGSNMFTVGGDDFQRCIVFRISLDELLAEQELSFEFFTAPDFSMRCTLGAKDVMYFGAHVRTDRIRVFRWPEAAATATSVDVNVTRWSGPPYSAPQNTSGNWMGRGDSRITAAWTSNGQLGFLWTANRQGAARPRPFVRAVRIDAASMDLLDEPDIWSANAAFGWVEACPNSRGDLAVSLFTGGGSSHPSHVVGIRTPTDPDWDLQIVTAGTNSPADGKWGDYLHMRPNYPDGVTWVTSAFTLQGGGNRTDIEPCFVHFSLQSDGGVTAEAAPLTS